MVRSRLTIIEKELVAKIKEGDVPSFQHIFKKYYSSLYLTARKIIPDQEIVKDIIQDVFAYIWNKREQLLIVDSIYSYLNRSVTNACLNELRKQGLKERYLEVIKRQHTETDFFGQLVADDLHGFIEDIVACFPVQRKIIFKMSRNEGFSHKEIGIKMNISSKTVESQIYRSLKEIRHKLQIISAENKKK